MIPRLNTCEACNQQAPAFGLIHQDWRDLHRALHDLFFVVIEGLRIDRLADRLAAQFFA